MEEARPGKAGFRIGVLGLELPPVFEIWIVNLHVGAHLREFSHDQLGAAVPGIAHVLAVRRSEDEDVGRGDGPVHVPQRVTDHLRDSEGPGVVDVHRGRRDAEDVVVEPEDVPVGPDSESSVLGEAVPAYAGAGEDHVRVRGTDPDGVDHLFEIHAVALGEHRPLVHERQYRRPVAVLDYLGGFGLDRAVQDGERIVLHVQNVRQEGDDPLPRLGSDAAADPPEVPDRGHVVPPGHDPLVAVGEERIGSNPSFLEGLLHDGICHLLGGAGRDGRFDKYEGAGPDVLRYYAEGLLQGGHVGGALAAVAEPLLQIVALDVHHDDVGQT